MEWMIYGANGYTGELIAREAKKRGASPILAGRDAAKIAKLATDLSLPSKVFSLDKPPDIVAALEGGCREIDFGRGPKLATPIPWGDVATAFYTTGIPNITVFTPISPSLLALARLMNAFGFILRSRHVQTWLIEGSRKQ